MAKKRANLPRSGTVLSVGSHEVHILECGDPLGPEVVMLHGCGSLAEEVMLPFETAGFRIMAPDRPGYGFSTALPRGECGPVGQSAWLEQVFDRLRLKKALLFAHSIGSASALHLAIRRPDLVRGVLLIAPCCRPVPFKPFLVLRTAVAPIVGEVVRQQVIGRWPDFFLGRGLRSSAFPNPLPLHLADLPAAHLVSPAAIQTMADELRAFNRDMQDLPDLPADIPLSILFGEQDRVIQPRWHLDYLRQRHPSPTVELLPDVGHLPHHIAPDLARRMLVNLAQATEAGGAEDKQLHVA
jgi:pimeloyl-ACP methyl ester carboxylesterase